MREKMRYAHFAKICENVAISKICGNRIKLTCLAIMHYTDKYCTQLYIYAALHVHHSFDTVGWASGTASGL